MRSAHRARLALAAASAAGLVLALFTAAPAQAQFGGFSLPSIARQATQPPTETRNSGGCPKGKSKSAGSALLGGMLGSMAGSAASRAGLGSFVPMSEFSSMISNVIACKLDPAEQKQAADATMQITRGDPKVGSSAQWTSQTRDQVSGKSTVVARNDADASGARCITVNDVVIVNGEETTANKRMCKMPGSARYTLMA
jgi:surface antigen